MDKATILTTLRKHPLMMLLAFMADKYSSPSLSLLAVSTTSDRLNDGSGGADPDDVTLLGFIPTVSTEGSLLRIDPVPEVIDSTLQGFFDAFVKAHLIPESAPGRMYDVTAIKDDFLGLLEDFLTLAEYRRRTLLPQALPTQHPVNTRDLSTNLQYAGVPEGFFHLPGSHRSITCLGL